MLTVVACISENSLGTTGPADTTHTSVDPPVAIMIMAGNAQSDTIDARLRDSLAVRVTSASGKGLERVAVIWQEPGGLVVQAETAATDTAGIAKTQWTLGQDIGQASLIAWVLGTAPLLADTFTATVLPGHGTHMLLVPQGLTQLLPADTLVLFATVYDRLGHSLLNPDMQWASSAPGVATVTAASPRPPGMSGGGVVHAVAGGRSSISVLSEDARDSVGITVVLDTAVYGTYSLVEEDTLAYPYCVWPSPVNVACYSGSLAIDGLGAYRAVSYIIVTLIDINQTLTDSSVVVGTYQKTSTCSLEMTAAGDPNGSGVKLGDTLTVVTDTSAAVQHRWVYAGGARPQSCS